MVTESDQGLVWHYTNLDGLLGMIKNQQLWATHNSYVNDSVDGFLVADALKKCEWDRGPCSTLVRQLIERELDDASRYGPTANGTSLHFDGMFLVSASRSQDELTLWRNYGRDFPCFAVGLDPKVPLGILEPNEKARAENLIGAELSNVRGWDSHSDSYTTGWMEVCYGDQSTIPHHVIRELNDLAHSDANAPDPYIDVPEIVRSLRLQAKSQAFCDEREVRLGFIVNKPYFWNFRNGTYGLTPYIALTPADVWGEVVHDSRKLPIEQIFISPGSSPSDIYALEMMLEVYGYRRDDVDVESVLFDDGHRESRAVYESHWKVPVHHSSTTYRIGR